MKNATSLLFPSGNPYLVNGRQRFSNATGDTNAPTTGASQKSLDDANARLLALNNRLASLNNQRTTLSNEKADLDSKISYGNSHQCNGGAHGYHSIINSAGKQDCSAATETAYQFYVTKSSSISAQLSSINDEIKSITVDQIPAVQKQINSIVNSNPDLIKNTSTALVKKYGTIAAIIFAGIAVVVGGIYVVKKVV